MRKTLAILLATTFLTVAQPREAKAEPISIAIASAIGITLKAGSIAASVATFALTTAASVGLSLVANLLTGQPAVPASGTTLETRYGGAVPRGAVLGQQIVSGHHIYSNVYGLENKRLQIVHVLGDGLHDSLSSRMMYNGKVCPLLPDPSWVGVDNPKGYIVDHRGFGMGELAVDKRRVYLRFYRGEWDQTADSILVANSNPVGRWTTFHRGRGICYAAIDQEYDEEAGLTGYPDVRFEINGLRLYDSRFDSTNGGSGTQRWGTHSTYVWSANPAVQEYNVRRGIYINDQLMIGMGVGPADLITPMYVACANDCDEDVPLLEGGNEPRYRCHATVSADRQHSEVLGVIRASMAGHTLERAGQFGPIAGVAQTVRTELTFTDDDLEVGKKADFSKYRSRSEIATAVYGKFSDPNQKGEAVAFPAREDVDDDIAMGERLSRDIDLTQIRSNSQAQRVAEIERRRSLVQEHGTAPLGAKWFAAQPGDWIPFTSDRHASLTVEVVNTTLNPDHSVVLTWRAVTNQIFSWTTAGELEGPFVPTGPQPGTIILAASGVGASGVNVAADNGLIRPGIRFTWTPIADQSVDAVQFEYRKNGDTEVIPFAADFPSTGMATATSGVQAATAYQWRHRLQTTPLRECPWSAWLGPVTSGSQHVVPTAQSTIPGGVTIESFNEALADAVTAEFLAGNEARDLSEQSISANAAAQHAKQFVDKITKRAEQERERVERALAVAEEAFDRAFADGLMDIDIQQNIADIEELGGDIVTVSNRVELGFGSNTGSLASLETSYTLFAGPGGVYATYQNTIEARFGSPTLTKSVSTIQNEWVAFAGLNGTGTSTVTNIESRFGSTVLDYSLATLGQRWTTFAGGTGAITTTATSIEARFGSPTLTKSVSTIQNEWVAFAGPSGSGASTLVNIEARFGSTTPDLSLATVASRWMAFAGPSGSYASGRQSIEARFGADALTKSVAQIQNEWTAFAGPEGAGATTSLNIESRFGGAALDLSVAVLIQQWKAFSDAGGAYASYKNTVETRFGAGTLSKSLANIINEWVSFAGPSGAGSTTTSSIEGRFGTYAGGAQQLTLAQIVERWYAFAGTDGAYAGGNQSIEARFGAETVPLSLSTVATQWQAFSGPDGNYASYQTSVTGRFQTVEGTASSAFSVASGIDSIMTARALVRLSAGGKATGYNLYTAWNQGVGSSSFDIDSDFLRVGREGVQAFETVFQVGTVAGAQKMALKGDFLLDGALTARMVTTGEFITLSAQIKNATIKTAHIDDLQVTTLKIGVNQVTVPHTVTSGAARGPVNQFTGTPGSPFIVMDESFDVPNTVSGVNYQVFALITGMLDITSPAATGITLRINLDGTLIGGWQWNGGGTTEGFGFSGSVVTVGNGGTKTHQVKLEAIHTGGGSHTHLSRSLFAMAAKR